MALATIAAILLVCSVSGSQAATSSLLQTLKPVLGVAAPQVLPGVSNPKPYRQGAVVTCDDQSHPNLGPNLCVLVLNRVPVGRLLQIDTINCGNQGGAQGVILFNSQLKADATHFIGAALPPSPPLTLSVAHGPYYLNAGETPKLASNGNSPSDTLICSVFGTLWQTN
jgi:hypothetical protein